MKILKIMMVFFLTMILSFVTYLYFYKPTNNDKLINRLSIELFDKNTYEVTYKDIDIENLKIIWSAELNQKDSIIFFSDGKIKGGIDSYYGPNSFKIYYKGKKQCHFGHFKTKRWYVHSYNFNIYLKNDSLRMGLKIVGPNEQVMEAVVADF